MSLASESMQTTFYEDSPPLSQRQTTAKFSAWQRGDYIHSTVTEVGMVPVHLGAALLSSRKILKTGYGIMGPLSNLHTPAIELLSKLHDVVCADIRRSDLQGDLRLTVWAGNYADGVHREAWHSDNFSHPSVRWTAAFGVGATRGAEGTVRKAHTNRNGDLRPQITVGPNGQLQELTFAQGAITRFLNTGDIHAGPIGDGARVMLQATLRLTEA